MIPYFIPDMPSAESLIPYLEEIDNSKWYSNFGPLYMAFKQRLSQTCLNCIDENRLTLVSSGTAAIELILQNLDIPPGSRVLTTSFTFPATVSAIIRSGFIPVVSDIDIDSWQLTPEIASCHLKTHNIKAIVPVSTFGMPVDSIAWESFSRLHNTPVIIDAAAALPNQTISESLHYAFSLHATKPIGVGEGGLVISPNTEFAESVRKNANFGFEADRIIKICGTNAKISEYHCAVGLAQLDRINTIQNKRRSIFSLYMEEIASKSLPLVLQPNIEHTTPACLNVLVDAAEIKTISADLAKGGVESRRLYWPLVHQHPGFKELTELSDDLDNATRISKSGIALPLHNHLRPEDIKQISDTFVQAYNSAVKI